MDHLPSLLQVSEVQASLHKQAQRRKCQLTKRKARKRLSDTSKTLSKAKESEKKSILGSHTSKKTRRKSNHLGTLNTLRPHSQKKLKPEMIMSESFPYVTKSTSRCSALRLTTCVTAPNRHSNNHSTCKNMETKNETKKPKNKPKYATRTYVEDRLVDTMRYIQSMDFVREDSRTIGNLKEEVKAQRRICLVALSIAMFAASFCITYAITH